MGGITGYVASDEITRLSAQEVFPGGRRAAGQAGPALVCSARCPADPGAAYSIPSQATRETVLARAGRHPDAQTRCFRY